MCCMEVNFACKTISLDKILKCSFELNNTELAILKYLDSVEKSAKDIGKDLQKDLATVQRNLKSLHEKKLIIRRQYNMDTGGYTFQYKSKPKKYMKQKMKENFEHFSKLVLKQIEDL